MNIKFRKRATSNLILLILVMQTMGMATYAEEEYSEGSLTVGFYGPSKVEYDINSPEIKVRQLTPEELEVRDLMNKFLVKNKYREYIKILAVIYNLDVKIALSTFQQESWNGHHKGYNDRSEKRAYWGKKDGKKVKVWDIGYAQLSTLYTEYWRKYFYNPELIRMLGYDVDEFSLENDYISIQVGMAYLVHLYQRVGTYRGATMSYNCGIGNYLEKKIPDLTREYTHAILNQWTRREGDFKISLDSTEDDV